MKRKALTRRAFLAGSVGGLGMALGPFRFFGVRNDPSIFADSFPALGTRLRVVIRTADERHARWAMRQAMAAVFDVHHCMTLHDESPLTVLNRRGELVVPESFIKVLAEAKRVHRESEGAFDPTVQSVAGGIDEIEVDAHNRRVAFHRPELSLDFNGIAKGYAVDRAVQALRDAGFDDFLVNAGGDLYASGTDAAGAAWDVRLDVPGTARRWRISDRAVATSGTLHQPIHLRSPTGHELQWQSATVLAPTCMQADAWATALFVQPHRGAPAWGDGMNGEWSTASGAIVEAV